MAGGQKNGYEPIKMQLSRPVLRVKKARVRPWTGPGSTMKCCVEEASEKFDANRTWVPKGLGMIRHLKDGSAWALTKGVASCDKLRVGARSLRSGDSRMGLPTRVIPGVVPYGRGNPPNGSSQ